MRIYVAGHTGMLGSAIVRALEARGYEDVVTSTHAEWDLMNWKSTFEYFDRYHPAYVFMAAGTVGGIQANIDDPASFLYENAQMALNVIGACETFKARLCYVGSSCVYPRECPQPMTEDMLMTGKLEPTNEGYAIAKIVGLKYSQYLLPDSVQPMPCNLYGTNDHYGENGHVLASLVRRFVDAVDNGLPAVTLWGTGEARREFLHVDDCARILVELMERGITGMINVGSGTDVSIRELAELIAHMTRFKGRIQWDASRPNGMMRKCLDTTKMNALGLYPEIVPEKGIAITIAEYRALKQAEAV